MKAELEEITDAALHLPTNDKAHLANRLLESIDEDEIERHWIEVAKQRRDEIRNGTAKTIPAEEVHVRIAARLAK
jgi:hypothetical protein